MIVRVQVIEDGFPALDTTIQARNQYTALHNLLRTHAVPYDPGNFREREGWTQFEFNRTVYRTMSGRNFG